MRVSAFPSTRANSFAFVAFHSISNRSPGRKACPLRRPRLSPASLALSRAFADAVSGEFEGHHISVDIRTGVIHELPSHVVPDAFREWGVTLFDWQTQCSSTRSASGTYVRDARFVPVVGCEADASTIETFERDEIDDHSMYTNDFGWYSAEYMDSKKVETATHCVVVEDGADAVRVRVKYPTNGAGLARVWRETYYEPFGDGKSLASACGQCAKSSKFGDVARTTAETVRSKDASFVAPSNAIYLANGIWFAFAVDDVKTSAYTSWLGYASEKANAHCVSRRSRDANGVVSASFERRPMRA